MTNFTVGPSPLQIIGSGVDNSPLTVQNTGKVSIYISGDPGVSTVAFEYKIDAGGDFIWPPGKPLSVCTGPGVIGQISYGGTGDVHVNSGSTNVTGAVTINGSVPIAGPVTVSGSVALNAGSTVAIAGPVAIAGTVPISGNVNIASGTVTLAGPVAISGGVSVTGSTINIGTPVKIANNLTVIANFSQAVAAGTTVIPLKGPYDVTPYASVIMLIYVSGTTSPVIVGNYIDVLLNMSGNIGGVYTNPQFAACTGQAQHIQISVTGIQLFANITIKLPNAFPASTFYFVFLGSGEAITKSRYLSQGDGMLGNIAQSGLFTRPFVTVSETGIFSSINGPANVNFMSDSNTQQARLTITAMDNGSASSYLFGMQPALSFTGVTGVPNQITFPIRPMVYQIQGSPGFNGTLSIMQEI